MPQETLRELLARVHERLSQAGSADPESRALLTTLLHDIERTLGRGGTAAAASSAKANMPRLEQLAVRFEAEHPALAEALMQFMDLLGKAGI